MNPLVGPDQKKGRYESASHGKPAIEIVCPISEIEKRLDRAQRGNCPTISPIGFSHFPSDPFWESSRCHFQNTKTQMTATSASGIRDRYR